ncbi:MAG: biliverdin-producing heme oxygenase [cyanobacterium endosymbiont of Rhopalodia musculus]|uniref:biliverdin-producing heme oxygenase n=1 Tax=cyanobacterium endosymbiont of Epithemia clementina EcSB TaxID=3034674 RepID=UPI00386CE40A
MLKGVVERNSYQKLIVNFYFVYSAIEEEIDKLRDYEMVSKIYFYQSNCKQALEQDLYYAHRA